MTAIQAITDLFIANVEELERLRTALNEAVDNDAKYAASNAYHTTLNIHNAYFQLLISHGSECFLQQIVPLWESDMMRPYHLKRAEITRDMRKKLKPLDTCRLILEFLGFE